MSILAAEPNLYPFDLLDGDSPEQRGRRWWAIYTKARQEKALARHLLRSRIPFYLPLIPKDNFIRGQRVQSHLPLFSGYVFLFGDDDERIESLKTNRISRILEVEEQAVLKRNLCHIRQLIAADTPLTVERRLVAGQLVRIKVGLLKGVEGVILSRRGRTRLLVSVAFMQQGASIEIDDFQVEPI